MFLGTVPYLLASVVHHHTWLKENLSAQLPLFQSLFWKGRMPFMVVRQRQFEWGPVSVHYSHVMKKIEKTCLFNALRSAPRR
jgi:hypothetical protein